MAVNTGQWLGFWNLLNLFITLFLSNSVLLSVGYTPLRQMLFLCVGVIGEPVNHLLNRCIIHSVHSQTKWLVQYCSDSSLKPQNRFFQWRGRIRWVGPTNEILIYRPYSNSIGSCYNHSLNGASWRERFLLNHSFERLTQNNERKSPVASYLEVCEKACERIVLHCCNINQRNISFKGTRRYQDIPLCCIESLYLHFVRCCH